MGTLFFFLNKVCFGVQRPTILGTAEMETRGWRLEAHPRAPVVQGPLGLHQVLSPNRRKRNRSSSLVTGFWAVVLQQCTH